MTKASFLISLLHAIHASPLRIRQEKPPFFLLAGDSTTAVGGGWGDGFLNTTLKAPASGLNYGHSGATTVSFRAGGDWAKVLGQIESHREEFEVFVTIQFGHNDQKPAANISLDEYGTNLAAFADEVTDSGGEPILLTPLTRRGFDDSDPPKVVENLVNERRKTIEIAETNGVKWIDLNLRSQEYCNAIGPDASWKHDLSEGDHTHLNDHGSVVFGRLVSDLLVGKYGELFKEWTVPNVTLSEALEEGVPA
ncbi:carbohydrate esterase family 12 protein [Pseudocercospora fijiensis CIRAD86]|uniref:Carbohydrate esterase family 12 protein n=1 Tax=Pseudocercospora fijiensis (strain CIRAD86) TaxID=383855 RepID=N1QA39_PSEFD|nr:carbohydrate esterase family 12 protein [Pseudocercospora fijiensis CIRAD86]EME87763.1 carbohydrate esterase family 12 protein [Pseudocercospora fijiensis CIRAD86]